MADPRTFSSLCHSVKPAYGSTDDVAPAWYVGRGNGIFVPLVATDELPPGIELAGAPRQLNECDLDRLRNQNSEFLGEIMSSGKIFWLSNRSGQVDKVSSSCPPLPSNVQYGGLAFSSTQSPGPPSGYEPDHSKKKYCTHWIRTGECDFLQQGCRYKHQMPDRTTLARIGFRSVPRWWQERHTQPRSASHHNRSRRRRHHHRDSRTRFIDTHHQRTAITPLNTPDESYDTSRSGSPELPWGNPDGNRYARKELPFNEWNTDHVPAEKRPASTANVSKRLSPTPEQRSNNEAPPEQQDRMSDVGDLITLDTPPRSPKYDSSYATKSERCSDVNDANAENPTPIHASKSMQSKDDEVQTVQSESHGSDPDIENCQARKTAELISSRPSPPVEWTRTPTRPRSIRYNNRPRRFNSAFVNRSDRAKYPGWSKNHC